MGKLSTVLAAPPQDPGCIPAPTQGTDALFRTPWVLHVYSAQAYKQAKHTYTYNRGQPGHTARPCLKNYHHQLQKLFLIQL